MDSLINKIRSSFQIEFERPPLIVRAPGRVNLIGEHTDYNDGFVLPAAIDKAIVLAMAPNGTDEVRLKAVDMDPPAYRANLASGLTKSTLHWPNYVLGIIDQLQCTGRQVAGFDCLFGGDIPVGAGLSSSAALECGVIFGLSQIFGLKLSRLEMAKLAQKAENEFVGVQCGIMDQFASLFGKSGRVLKLDCRSLEYEPYPFENDEVHIVLFDTQIKRELAGSEYNLRRSQCEEGVRHIRRTVPSVSSLRDVTPDLLRKHKKRLDRVVYRRCKYVLEENQRVVSACRDLLKGDLATFGDKMYRSHDGLRDLYEVSCAELDVLVEATEPLEDVPGARMMGGGFGGCTVNLVWDKGLEQVVDEVTARYKKQTGRSLQVYTARIGNGVGLIAGTGRSIAG